MASHLLEVLAVRARLSPRRGEQVTVCWLLSVPASSIKNSQPAFEYDGAILCEQHAAEKQAELSAKVHACMRRVSPVT